MIPVKGFVPHNWSSDGKWFLLDCLDFDDYKSKPEVLKSNDTGKYYAKRGWNSDKCEMYYEESFSFLTPASVSR